MKRLIKFRRNLLILTLANVLIFIGCSKKDDADTTAPKLPDTAALTVTDVAPLTATVKWTAASDDRTAPDKLLYLVQWQAAGAAEASNSGTPQPNLTEYTLTGLTQKTAYKVWVTVTDEAGNHADYEAKDFTTPEAKDTEAPKAGSLEITNLTYNSATAKWTGATDNRTAPEKLKYQVQWNAKGSAEVKNSGTPQANLYSFDLKDLAEKTTYEVRVVVFDETGNQAQAAKDFTTPAKPKDPEPEYYTPERFNSWAVKPKIAKGETHFIVIEVDQQGRSIFLNLKSNDPKKVWGDFNNNGKRDEGEEISNNRIHFKGTTVVTIYGDFTESLDNGGDYYIQRLDVANAPNLKKLNLFKYGKLTSLDVSTLKNLESLDISNCDKLDNLIVDKANNSKLNHIELYGTPYEQAAKLKPLLQALPDTKGTIQWHKAKVTGTALKEAVELQNSTSWDLRYFTTSESASYPRAIASDSDPVITFTLDPSKKDENGRYFTGAGFINPYNDEVWLDLNNNGELDEGEKASEYQNLIIRPYYPSVNIYGKVKEINLNYPGNDYRANITNVSIKNHPFIEKIHVYDTSKIENITIDNCSALKYIRINQIPSVKNVTIKGWCEKLETLHVIRCENKPNITINATTAIKEFECHGNSYSAKEIENLIKQLPSCDPHKGIGEMIIYYSDFDDNSSYKNNTTLSEDAKTTAKNKNWRIISRKGYSDDKILNP